jgi:A/G-specific adenine glycosylase
VFIHSFFRDRTDVKDKEIISLVEQSIDTDNPREWYYALMDYGVFLKSRIENPSRKSVHYTKQPKFEGSDRQLRAKILKYIVTNENVSHQDILLHVAHDAARSEKIIEQLLAECFIKKTNDIYFV